MKIITGKYVDKSSHFPVLDPGLLIYTVRSATCFLTCLNLSIENPADLEDEEDQDIISSSVEQLVGEENEVQPDSLDECYLAASTGHHLAGSCHPYRSASFPTESGEVFLTLNVNGDTWEDCHQGPVSFPGSEVPTSQAQLQKSTHVTDCLQWQLDQHFDCGDSKAMLGLSSTNWGFTSNIDSGNQGPLFLGKKEKGIRKLWSMCWSSQSCGWRRQSAFPTPAVSPVETCDTLTE
ncbi:neuroblastoma breakpoint family member 4-like [Moschus berezovskii]|uniref:neuroblastoma breakpoint family member 4-like n=1 Tax=Moschus berezovskii TaxID=68408 RepID=UPI00244480D1|nr:neuroblastoma breakpoint family member 4-like [Moschus berezovskii]